MGHDEVVDSAQTAIHPVIGVNRRHSDVELRRHEHHVFFRAFTL